MRYNLTNDNITIMNGPELGRRWVSNFNQQKLMFLLQSPVGRVVIILASGSCGPGSIPGTEQDTFRPPCEAKKR